MNKDLTKGHVGQQIIKLALPIIGTSLMQLAYNFTDMLWVGKLGSNAVAAIGTSGFFLHLGWAIVSVVLVGAGISVSHAIGKKDEEKARYLTLNALMGVLFISVSYAIVIQFLHSHFIAFFQLNSAETEHMAHAYLRWSSVGLVFLYFGRLFSKISHARGDSKLPFKIATISIVVNIILDPIFIFVLDFGVLGAAWATIIAQMVTAALFWYKRAIGFLGKPSTWSVSFEPIKDMIKLGFGPAMQSILFSVSAIVMGKIISEFSADAIAAQKIGLQIEAITVMAVGGINGAIVSFTGQNYGAQMYQRVRQGFNVGVKIAIVFGVIMTAIFQIFPEQMVRWFVSDMKTVKIGADYIRIIGLSQLFMSIDFVSTGVLHGMGKTKLPSTINIVIVLMRLPLALFLSQYIGVNGIWLAKLISSALRGIINTSLYLYIKPTLLPKEIK